MQNYDVAAIQNAVKDAIGGAVAGLAEEIHALTNPQPSPSVSFTDEEKSAMAQAVADLRQRKAAEAAKAEEEAKHNAFKHEVREALIRSRHAAPETDAERKLWRKVHGFDYTNSRDLR